MAVITEEAARRLTADGRREVRLAAEDIVTPAAKTYFQEKRVTLSTDQAPSAAMEDRYTTVFGAVLSEKPEHMTHLRGNLLVFKDHPRIILRGKIDSLESAIILVQAKALEAGDSALSAELEEVITFIRHLLRCEVSGEPVGEFQLLGLDAPALRDQSHHPSKYFGIRHFLPGVQYGPMVAELNRLRTMTRETELAAFQAFKGQHGEMDRVDIIRAFNRLSSLFWIMMFKERQKQQI